MKTQFRDSIGARREVGVRSGERGMTYNKLTREAAEDAVLLHAFWRKCERMFLLVDYRVLLIFRKARRTEKQKKATDRQTIANNNIIACVSLVKMCSTHFGPVNTKLPSHVHLHVKPTILINVPALLSDRSSLGVCWVEYQNLRSSRCTVLKRGPKSESATPFGANLFPVSQRYEEFVPGANRLWQRAYGSVELRNRTFWIRGTRREVASMSTKCQKQLFRNRLRGPTVQ
jgi:hypothetical protein